MKTLNIYEIHHNDEKTWVCDYTLIKALKRFADHQFYYASELWDDSVQDIIIVPSINWNQYMVRMKEPSQENITFYEFMKHQQDPEVISSALN